MTTKRSPMSKHKSTFSTSECGSIGTGVHDWVSLLISICLGSWPPICIDVEAWVPFCEGNDGWEGQSTDGDDSTILSTEGGGPSIEGNEWVILSRDGYDCVSLWTIGIEVNCLRKCDMIVIAFFFGPIVLNNIKEFRSSFHLCHFTSTQHRQ